MGEVARLHRAAELSGAFAGGLPDELGRLSPSHVHPPGPAIVQSVWRGPKGGESTCLTEKKRGILFTFCRVRFPAVGAADSCRCGKVRIAEHILLRKNSMKSILKRILLPLWNEVYRAHRVNKRESS